MSDSESEMSSHLSNYESDNESEQEKDEIDERFNNFFYKDKDFTPCNKEYENPMNLIADIETLSDAIENGFEDNEVLHQVEDWLIQTFFYHISKETYYSDTIKKIATLFADLPEYEKWYA
jgi:hypothetical protein